MVFFKNDEKMIYIMDKVGIRLMIFLNYIDEIYNVTILFKY